MVKARCRLCEEPPSLSQLLGPETLKDVLYGLFDKEGLQEGGAPFDLEEALRSMMGEDLWKKYSASRRENARMEEMMNYFYPYYNADRTPGSDPSEAAEEAREKAWRELVRKLRTRRVRGKDLSRKQLVEHFEEELIQELQKEGLLQEDAPGAVFTAEGERLMAEKVLDEVFARLDKSDTGAHEVLEGGVGTYPSHLLTPFDEWLHSFDTLDIQETLLRTARRDPGGLAIGAEDLTARIPLHRARAATVIAIDKSTSMSWSPDKIKGAVKAALGLRHLLETEYREDELHVVAYDHEPHPLQPGQIAALVSRTGGWTDIGLAMDSARELLEGAEGNKSAILITDGWPTASSHPRQTPAESALRAAHELGRANVRLVVMMLNTHPGLRRLCSEMAMLNGNATVAYVDDPLTLKEFVIRNYVREKRG